LAQFVAGLTVLLDLIGAERLRGLGIKWRKASTRLIETARAFARPRMAFDLFLYTLDLLKYFHFRDEKKGGFIKSFHSGGEEGPHEELARLNEKGRIIDERYGIPVGKLIAILIRFGFVVIMILGSIPIILNLSYNATYVSGIAFLVLLLSGPIIAFSLFVFAGITMAPVVIVLRPVAWLLDRGNPGYHIRWIAFFVFLIGFYFDLLST
jgi:hypothetical protein